MSIDKAEQMFELFSTCKDSSVWWNEKNVHIRSSTILLLQFRGLSFATFIFASTFGMSPFQALTKFSRGQKTCNTCSNCTQFWWRGNNHTQVVETRKDWKGRDSFGSSALGVSTFVRYKITTCSLLVFVCTVTWCKMFETWMN